MYLCHGWLNDICRKRSIIFEEHYYLDSLGGVGEVYDVYTVVCHSGLQDLRTVTESEQVPTRHAGDFWHKKVFIDRWHCDGAWAHISDSSPGLD